MYLTVQTPGGEVEGLFDLGKATGIDVDATAFAEKIRELLVPIFREQFGIPEQPEQGDYSTDEEIVQAGENRVWVTIRDTTVSGAGLDIEFVFDKVNQLWLGMTIDI